MRWVILPTFDRGATADDVDGWLRAARAVEQEQADVIFSDVDVNLPDSYGGGDATWDLETAVPLDELPTVLALLTPGRGPLRSCVRVALDPVRTGSQPMAGPRVKRTLLLTVKSGTEHAVVEQFEQSMAAMADHVPEIRSWSLSRVDPDRSAPPWTHVWEQEFVDFAGLRRGYLTADYHVTAVERWFDPEIPGAIVETVVAHLMRWAQRPVLARDASV